jgi:hypothetical protein
MKRTEISAADALKAFKTKPSVQVAKAVKIPVVQDGRKVGERPGFETKTVSCAEEHVTGAAKYGDGRVVITTIDGAKHETNA